MSNSWSAPDWVRDAVFYQIFPERFCNGDPSNDPPNVEAWDSPPTRDNFLGGDLVGIQSKVDYLQQLGITALYTTPIFQAGTNHRYDCFDYLKIDPMLGTLDDFYKLLNKLHQHDIRFVLDAVFNHCGTGFWAFQDVVEKGRDSAYWDWFTVADYPITYEPPSYQTCGGAYIIPKLNTQNPEVREYLLKVTRYWLELGVDGWRLDVPWKVPMDFWREFRRAADSVSKDAYLVAEVWRGTDTWLQGDTIHGVMNYQFRNLILDYCVGHHLDAEDLDYELIQLQNEHGSTAPYHLNLLGSHDTPRILTLCRNDINILTLCIVLQMTYIGVPMIYYGDEIGMAGDNDPHCRAGMVWDESQQNHTIQTLYKKLIRLRRCCKALTEGSFEPLKIFNAVYAYERHTEDESIIVILNPRETHYNIHIPLGRAASQGGEWYDLLTGTSVQATNNEFIFETLPACSTLVLLPAHKKDLYVQSDD